MAKKGYRRGNECPDCGTAISDRATKCRVCTKRQEHRDSKPLMGWRYDCHCGITAYSFDGASSIRDGAGHEVQRGARAICNGGEFYDYCPACGASAGGHSFERQEEMLYVACCPDGN